MAKTKEERILEAMRANGFTGEQTCDFERCKRCGGTCCKTNSCAYAEWELSNVTKEGIVAMIEANRAMICSALIRVKERQYIPLLYLAAPERYTQNGVRIGIMRSPCALWRSQEGCSLFKRERPAQGIGLIPDDMKWECTSYIQLDKDIVDGWKKHSHILETIVLERTGKTPKQLMEEELYSKRYDSPFESSKVSLPVLLKQKLEISVLFNGNPLTAWEYSALEILFSIRFFKDYKGDILEQILLDLFDCIRKVAI